MIDLSRTIVCDLFAGGGSFAYWCVHAKPPISYMGSKVGYMPTIAAILGLDRRKPPAGIVLGEIGPMAAVHATLGGARGNAEEVAGWLSAAELAAKGDPLNGYGGEQERHDAGKCWTKPDIIGASSKVAALPHPRAAEVAAIIRSWKDEEPRALWERLKAAGWPSLMRPVGKRWGWPILGRWLGPQSVQEVAGMVMCSAHSYRWTPSAGFNTTEAYGMVWKGSDGKPDGIRPATTPDKVADSVAALPTFPPLAVWQGGADRLVEQLPGRLEGWVCYLDPPYKGDGSRKITGYPHGDFSREDTLRLATELHRRGAVVAVSECVGLARELGEGWNEVEISHGRKGQKRTFSTETAEWLTLNREPQHRPHLGQQGLFGGGA